MAPLAAGHPLPTTRLQRRRRGRSGWALAVLLTLTVNLGVVLLLSQVSRVVSLPHAPPRAHRITAVEPPLEIEELVTSRPEPLEPEPLPEALPLPQLPLPALELGDEGPADALRLPELAIGADLSQLPLSVPAFSIPAAESAPGLAGPAGEAGWGELSFDQAPQLRSAFDLDRYYPRLARQRGVTGSSTLRLDIDAQGRVTAVVVAASDPPGVFEQAAERLGRALRFTPAERAGQPVASRFTVTLKWSLDR